GPADQAQYLQVGDALRNPIWPKDTDIPASRQRCQQDKRSSELTRTLVLDRDDRAWHLQLPESPYDSNCAALAQLANHDKAHWPSRIIGLDLGTKALAQLIIADDIACHARSLRTFCEKEQQTGGSRTPQRS